MVAIHVRSSTAFCRRIGEYFFSFSPDVKLAFCFCSTLFLLINLKIYTELLGKSSKKISVVLFFHY